MFIDLNKISEHGIIVDQEVEFNEDKYNTSLIKGIDSCYLKGRIYYSTTKEVILSGNIKGNMLIVDSNTCDIIKYPFDIEINEILQEDSNFDEKLRTKTQESLDLREILWQNIVLEVPLKFSISDKPELTKGEGWELKSEDEVVDPRLQAFRDLLKEKE